MFQTFDTRSERHSSAARVRALREQFDELGIDAFFVPHADEHQSEYPAPYAERLAWLSGFTGSAGFAIVTRDEAFIFSDGRYTLQLAEQTDGEVWTRLDITDVKLTDFLADQSIGRLGIDPWLHTIAGARRVTDAVEKGGGTLVRLARNPIDRIWTNRPPRPSATVTIHRVEHAGKLARDKLEEVRTAVRETGAHAHVVTDILSLAWLFNIRGSDVAHNPFALGWAVIYADRRPVIVMSERRMHLSTRAYLTQLADLAPDGSLPEIVADAAEVGPLMLDPNRTPDALRGIIDWAGGTIIEKEDPTLLPRAIKNEVEVAGARAAHRRDGAAMAAFLAWLDQRKSGSVSEIDTAMRLEDLRRETAERLGEPLREIAFDTIAGSGPHGAVVHYRVTRDTDRTLEDGELFLVDSGGQYLDGTTDITRTVAIGEPTEEMRERFTLVLKGMIGISTLRFPSKIEGRHIDSIARAALWRHGLDYAHGTGHGVGSYGAVHEGPQGLSRRSAAPLVPGMIVSNEPGYYKRGEYGIRIENLVLVHEPEAIEGGEIDMLGFETLTLCPIDRRLIDPSLLAKDELDWLDAYHARVLREIEPLLDDESTKRWLREACAPIGRSDKGWIDRTIATLSDMTSDKAQNDDQRDTEEDHGNQTEPQADQRRRA